MKKIFLMTFVACFTLFAACQKDDNINTDVVDDDPTTEVKPLVSTTWTAHQIEEYLVSTDMYVSLEMTLDCEMTFTDETNGTLSATAVVDAYMMGTYMTSYPATTHTYDFTYTLDGATGTIQATEGGQTLTIPFTYDEGAKTINFSLSQMMEEYGIMFDFDLIFTQKN